MGAKHFGARVTRLEDPALLSGRGRFVDDVKLPAVLHACFVRSPHAHARLRGIDGKPALSIPGVHAVLTADDMPGPMRNEPMPMLLPNPSLAAARTQTVLARAEVCYVGQPVAVVIADTRYIAEDAAAAVVVDYDVLAAVGDCRDAIKNGAPRVHGDLEFERRLAVSPDLRRYRRRLCASRACVRRSDLAAPRRRHGDGNARGAGEPRSGDRPAYCVVRYPDAAYRPPHARRSHRP